MSGPEYRVEYEAIPPPSLLGGKAYWANRTDRYLSKTFNTLRRAKNFANRLRAAGHPRVSIFLTHSGPPRQS